MINDSMTLDSCVCLHGEWSLDVFEAGLDEMVENQDAATPEWKQSQLVFLEQGNDRAGLEHISTR